MELRKLPRDTGAWAVVMERGDSSWGACCPDLPGCIAVADTEEETIALIKEAVRDHLELLRMHGESTPIPASKVFMLSV